LSNGSSQFIDRDLSRCVAEGFVQFVPTRLGVSIGFVPAGCSRERATSAKKTDLVEHPEVFDHVGLLVNRPLGTAEVPFI